MKELHLPIHVPCRSNLILGLKTTIILTAAFAIFCQDLTIVVNDALQSEFMSHILSIPFLFGYLIYRKRKMIRASISFESQLHTTFFSYKEIVGCLLFFITFLVYSYGSYTFTPLEFHMFALPIFVTACILIMFNTQTLRQLAFPIVFLLFLTPPPLQIVYTAGAALSTFSSVAACNILKILGLPVSLTTQYGTPVIMLQKSGGPPLTFAVDVACSGIYSIIGFFIFATFVAYIARTGVWKKGTMFLIGFPLIYALNILRIAIIVLIGNYAGMALAMQAFHLLGGWFLIFLGTLVLLIISERIFKIQFFTTKSNPASCSYCNRHLQNKQHFCPACGKLLNPPKIKLSKRDLSKIAVLITSIILIVNLQVPVFALTEGPPEVNIQTLGNEQTTAQILPEIPGYTTNFVYRDKQFEKISGQDASLIYAYFPTSKSGKSIWVTIEIAKAISSLHPWEFCLITWQLARGYQPEVTQLSLRDIQLLQNPPITARYFAFQNIRTNLTQVILYWYENAFFNTGSNPEQKHVKISLIIYTNSPEEIPRIEDQLLPLGKAISNYWQPIKIWSQIAQITLTISQNGAALIAITATLLAMVLTYQTLKKQKEKRSNLKVYNKLALKEERLLLEATHQSTQESTPTGHTIASYYQKLAGKPSELELLFRKLNEAEEAGLIKKDIMSREDEPTLIWKTHISFPKPSMMRTRRNI